MFGATTPLASKSEVVTLGDDEEVEAWMLDTVSVNPLQVLAIAEQKVGFPYTVSAYQVVFEREGSEPVPEVELLQFGIINPHERCGSSYYAVFLLSLRLLCPT